MIVAPFSVVVVDPLPDKLRALFETQARSRGFEFSCPGSSSIEELQEVLPGANALLTRKRTIIGEFLDRAGQGLKLVQVMGRLADRVDLPAASSRGVNVATMPHAGAQAVAEHAFALMQALSRQLVRGHIGVVEGAYRKRGLEPAPTTEFNFAFNWLGFSDVCELRNKTLGLIGFGEIGKEVAWRARGFEMRILYHQRNRLPERYEQVLGASWKPLEELLESSDFVSLHVPHTPDTEGMLDRRLLGLIKPNAYLVNTARGGVVQEDVLVEFLAEKRIAGAGLDVFVEEPLPANHPLVALDNVILAPHTGGGSGGGQKQHFSDVLDNIERVAKGGLPEHQVA